MDINSATAGELVQIKHIGSVRAAQIIELRPFGSLDGLTRVKGIAEKRLADIKAQGLACVGS
ncbi:MAG: helix-hairpin-helix domain-containing protein [Dehalococcoidia bacterium]|nr:helix-hairpin-helix domain-containing protein [Dehalococcoidia bacterium]